jgi:hypothetical protein
VFLLALLARITVALVIFALHGGQLFGDDKAYYDLAAQRATGNTAAWTPYLNGLYRTTAGYTLPITGLYALVGPHVLLGQLYTAVLGALAAAGTTAVAVEVLRPRLALASGAAVALLPSQVLWSSLTLKDAAVWAVMSALALTIAIAGRTDAWRRSLAWLIVLGGLLVLMGFLRHHTLVVACWAAAIASWAGQARTRRLRGSGAVALALLVPTLVGLGVAGLGLVSSSTSTLETRRANNATGATTAVVRPPALPSPAPPADSVPGHQVNPAPGGKETARPTGASASPTQVAPQLPSDEIGGGQSLHYLPRGLEVILLEPAPWTHARTGRVRFAQLESVIWWPMLFLAIFGCWSARRCLRVLGFPALAAGATAVMYGLSEGNFGTAFRHRGELVWAVALLAGAGLQSLMHRRTGSQAIAASGDDNAMADSVTSR